ISAKSFRNSMKIIITGEPKSGKSTLLFRLISDVKRKQGFHTVEIREQGNRIGFEMIPSDGSKKRILAHMKIQSEHQVSKYSVDTKALDEICESVKKFSPDDLLYIDEIGQMELFSEKFKDLVRSYLSSKNNFIGTLTAVYSDDFTKEIHSRTDTMLFHITEFNREEIYEKIKALI
ncbi:MAG TPA: nucleoside-triphosphatase, partial [Candidatus Paceibacterota bacterium]|nr:nucleoside-triphosphatase [Candidatus Paceibacterota bacterium]